jgi:F-type H+-transporting ATPase subunit b
MKNGRACLRLSIQTSMALAILFCFSTLVPAYGQGQNQSSQSQSSAQNAPDKNPAGQNPQAQSSPAKSSASAGSASDQGDQQSSGVGRTLARETREAEGEDEEEHANLKHSPMVVRLGKLVGLNAHQAHIFALVLNFGIIVLVIFWFGRKSVPGILRKRSESIQSALAEARKASEEANRRLADIEGRLRQMDVEIGKMQSSAEKEAASEDARIKQAAEDEIRKVVEAAELEIAATAKQARRDLSTHTADLAIALARKQINVDSNTDQVLVRDFAAKLGKPSPGGKDGR